MTFQYFFFDTYVGYFLQALPIALLVGAGYGLVRFGRDRETPVWRKLFSCAFVCYLTGLVCLTLGLELMGIVYYTLLYHMGSGREIAWFGGAIDLVPDFFRHVNGEVIGNLLLFVPFGVLHPLSRKAPTWTGTVRAGLFTVVLIEALQPVFGRALDGNDLILNGLGVLVSASLFLGGRRALGRAKGRRAVDRRS